MGLPGCSSNIEKVLHEEPSRFYTYRTRSADEVNNICISALDSAARNSERGSLCTEQSLLQATGVSTSCFTSTLQRGEAIIATQEGRAGGKDRLRVKSTACRLCPRDS